MASVPPDGAVVIATVGTLVYPDPSSFKVIFLIYPVAVETPTVAVDPIEINFKVVMYP